MSRPVGSLLPPYDKLREALLGLCMQAQTTYTDQLAELVDRFRKAYPEIGLIEKKKEVRK